VAGSGDIRQPGKLGCRAFAGSTVTSRKNVTDLDKGGAMNIYVGNLPLEMTGDELRKVFIIFGEVLSVIMMNDEYIGSGQTRGYGYVQMASKSEGAAAIANLEGKILKERVVNVVEALPLSNKSGMATQDIKNNRFNKKRERKYQII
jgi:RNA recognition motif-containing protein